jgi:hypothetical protein
VTKNSTSTAQKSDDWKTDIRIRFQASGTKVESLQLCRYYAGNIFNGLAALDDK